MRRRVVEFAGVLLVVTVAAALSIPALREQRFPTIWTGGVAIAIIARTDGMVRRILYGVTCVVGAGMALWLAGVTPLEASLGAAVQGVIYIVITRIVRRFLPKPIASVQDAWALIAISAAAAVVQFACLLPIVMLVGEHRYPSELTPVIGVSVSTFIGMLVFLPIALLATQRKHWRWRSPRARAAGLAWFALQVMLLAAVFMPDANASWPALAFVTVPIIVMFASVAPPVWTAMSLLVVTEAAAFATALHHGPFAPLGDTRADFQTASTNVQLFLCTIPTTAWLLLGAVTKNRNNAVELERRMVEQQVAAQQLVEEANRRASVAQELRAVSERFGAAVMGSKVAMGFGPMTEELGDFNDAMCDFYGVSREELAESRWTDFLDKGADGQNLALQRRLAAGEIDTYEVVQPIVTPAGDRKWGRVTATAVRSEDGSPDWGIAQIVDVTGEVEAQRALQQLADEDRVTGLASRDCVTERVERELADRSSGDRRIAVMFLELAPFLDVYRGHGYEAGDGALRELGARVRGCLPPTAMLGRYEGMTLVALLLDPGDVDQLTALAATVLEAVSQELEVGGRRISRTGNIGLAVSRPGSTVVSLLQDADLALMHAKSYGRSRWQIVGFDDGTEEPLAPMELEHELRIALDSGQFVTYFQPQVRLDDRSICGYESLVRWQHPERGLLLPANFMPIMEASGLVTRMGRQVLGMVCDAIRRNPGLPGPVSVNVSAIELDDDAWLAGVIDTVRASGIDPSNLVIELTETAVVDLTGTGRDALQRLRELGLGIHIDDFGTGYTSIGTLLALPVTALKLDRSFAAQLHAPALSEVALVRAIAALATSLGLETIAEGIEDEEQAQVLQDAGWAVGQGFLFGRAAPAFRP